MAELIHPSKKSLRGPWLIEYEKMRKLDDIIDSAWERALESREKQIEEDVATKLSAYPEMDPAKVKDRVSRSWRYEKANRTVTVTARDGKKIQATTFTDIAKEDIVKDMIFDSFEIRVVCGQVRVGVDLGDSGHNGNLSYSVDEPDYSLTRDVLHDLDRWADSVRPAAWVKWWRRIGHLHWLVAVLFILVSSYIVTEYQRVRELRESTRLLLADGISADETNKALEILLSYHLRDSSRQPSPRTESGLDTFDYVSIGLIALCTVISIKPRNCLGVGRGEQRVRAWKRWIRFVSISVPSGVLLPLMLDRISALLLVR